MTIDPDPAVVAFWRRVDIRGPEECWPWLGPVQSETEGKEYGEVRVNGVRGAHRVAWTIEYGEIPDGFEVRHLCERVSTVGKRCCNPAHLDAAPRSVNDHDRRAINCVLCGLPVWECEALDTCRRGQMRGASRRHYQRKRGVPVPLRRMGRRPRPNA